MGALIRVCITCRKLFCHLPVKNKIVFPYHDAFFVLMISNTNNKYSLIQYCSYTAPYI